MPGAATPTTTGPASVPAGVTTVDARPRIEGHWTVVYTPKNYAGEVDRVRWRVTPKCDLGPCGFLAKRSDGGRRDFRYSPSIGDYTLERKGFDDCVYETGAVATRKGYRWTAQTTLRVKSSEVRNGVRIATKLSGKTVYRSNRTKAGLAGNCRYYPDVQVDNVVAVRTR